MTKMVLSVMSGSPGRATSGQVSRGVVGGAAAHRIALMCAEKEPLDCHRTHLVAKALDAAGVEVMHILADGEIERHARTMERQPKADSGRKPEEDMFPEALIEATTKNRSERIAFVRKNHVSDPERKDR